MNRRTYYEFVLHRIERRKGVIREVAFALDKKADTKTIREALFEAYQKSL